jgi:dTDP-4-amino-4,6-dideoxygalactose transaminase
MLPHTETVAARVIVMPTGTALETDDVVRISDIVRGIAG